MRNFRIVTTLNVVPTKNLTEYWYKLTRGTSTNIMFDLIDRAYNFDDIVQLTYRFTNKDKQIIFYNMYTYLYHKDGSIEAIFNDKYFEHVTGYSVIGDEEVPYEYINLKLSGDDTNNFWLADKKAPVLFEIVVTLNNHLSKDTKDNYTVIEKQLPVLVFDNRGE